MLMLPEAFLPLAFYNQFIVYQLKPRPDGKTDKLPVAHATGRLPASGKGGQGIWTDSDTAIAAVARLGAGYGVGFSFAGSDPFWFIDLDDALQPDNTWAPWALEVVAMLPGCCLEISQSGRGIHLFGSGVVPPHACSVLIDNHRYEMYHTGRFVALTGIHASGDITLDCTVPLAAVVAKYFPLSAGIAPAPAAPMIDRDATDENIEELRSALKSLDADDYHVWTSVGLELASLGERGFDLWEEWSAASDKHNPSSDLDKWRTFAPTRTSWQGVFTRAQAAGWVNPKAHKPVDLNDMASVFGTAPPSAVPADTPIPAAQLPDVHEKPRRRTGSNIADIDAQEKIFAGCVYIEDQGAVIVPDGSILQMKAFNDRYNKWSFVKTNEGSIEKSAWNAFVQSQTISNWPFAHSSCFRPELRNREMIRVDGRTLCNVYRPMNTASEPGDVGIMLRHFELILPLKRDRDLYIYYLAAMVQNSGKKFRWCPVLQGAKGNGKSIIGDLMEKIVGFDYTSRPNALDIGNKFTGWLEHKLLVVLEELGVYEKRETMEMLKPLITNMRVEIQRKGRDQYTGDNRANFLIFVNDKNAVPIDKDERRYAAFFTAHQSNDDLKRDGMDSAYFCRLGAWIDGIGAAHFHHYLRTLAIPDEMNPAVGLQRAPLTGSTAEAIEVSRGAVEAEILHAIDSGLNGFCGGWISSLALDALIKENRMERACPRVKRREVLESLGYIRHPALHDGQVNQPIPGDTSKARLYITVDHPMRGLTKCTEIVKAYSAAQSPFASGVMAVYKGEAEG